MKNRNYLLIILLLNLIALATYAQDAKRRLRDFTPEFTINMFKVDGKCGICTFRILNALKVGGVKSAYWNNESKILTVQYIDNKIKLNQMYLLLAAVGHDTDKIKAKKDTYDALPICCHYRGITN